VASQRRLIEAINSEVENDLETRPRNRAYAPPVRCDYLGAGRLST
jgi:hypothetical protein